MASNSNSERTNVITMLCSKLERFTQPCFLPFMAAEPIGGSTVGRSVTSYFQNLKMKVFLRVFHQGSLQTSQKCRIASL